MTVLTCRESPATEICAIILYRYNTVTKFIVLLGRTMIMKRSTEMCNFGFRGSAASNVATSATLGLTSQLPCSG